MQNKIDIIASITQCIKEINFNNSCPYNIGGIYPITSPIMAIHMPITCIIADCVGSPHMPWSFEKSAHTYYIISCMDTVSFKITF